MDYYSAWPTWRVPKWVGAILGGVFTLILCVCIGLIVHLTRPAQLKPPAHVTAVPAVAAAPAVAPVQPSTATKPAEPAAAEASAAANVEVAAPVAAHDKTAGVRPRHRTSRHKTAAILAKQESKTKRQPKSELDRLLGL